LGSRSSLELELTEFDLALGVVFGPRLELTKLDLVLGVVLVPELERTKFDLVLGNGLGLMGLDLVLWIVFPHQLGLTGPDFAMGPGLGLTGLGLVLGIDLGRTGFDLERWQTLYSCVTHAVRVGRIPVNSRRTVWRYVQEILILCLVTTSQTQKPFLSAFALEGFEKPHFESMTDGKTASLVANAVESRGASLFVYERTADEHH
jgi:hypothetical protein